MVRLLGTLVAALVFGMFLLAPNTSAVASAPEPEPTRPTPIPVEFDIPSIDSSSTLIPLEKDYTGKLEVPSIDAPLQAGWYVDGVKPGDIGPAVIAGHINGRVDGIAVPGVFANLHKLKPGDQVHVLRSDDSEISFAVTAVRQYDKDEFPTEMVYGNTVGSELRLITCGGDYDKAAHSYEDNIVVYLSKVA